MMPRLWSVFARERETHPWMFEAGPFRVREDAFEYVWRQRWKGANNPGAQMQVFVYDAPKEDHANSADMTRARHLYEKWNEGTRT